MILVTAGLIYHDGKILITKRRPGTHGALKWEFPGGKVEENEDPRDTLVREIREELAIDVRVEQIKDVIFHRYPERSVLLLFYVCRWISGEPKALGCDSFDWADPSRLTEYDFLEADLDFIRRIEMETA